MAIPLSASIGVVERRPGEELHATVDRAMYTAKVGGRNRVCAGGEQTEEPVMPDPVAHAAE